MEGSKANRRRVKGCSRIKDRNSRLSLREDEVRRMWMNYFEDLYNIGAKEQVEVLPCGFDEVQRGN